MQSLTIVGVADAHTTPHYFERAAERTRATKVLYQDRLPHPPNCNRDDLLFLIDPVIHPVPRGLEDVICPIAGYLIDVHQGLKERVALLPFLDVVFVAQKDYIAELAASGCSTAHWLPLAFEPQLFPRRAAERYDVAFVGRIGAPGTMRHDTLMHVLPKVRSNDYTRSYRPTEMAQVYAQSKIVLNASVAGDLNMRVFEALGSGAMLITDRITNGLSELFTEDRHYVGYGDPAEAYDKVRFFLKNESARHRLARAGHELALAEHTYDKRWRAVQAIVSQKRSLSAPMRTVAPSIRAKQLATHYASLRAPTAVLGLLRSPISRGTRAQLLISLLQAAARRANSLVPLTPGAFRARFGKA